jgi:hypothetical protein
MRSRPTQANRVPVWLDGASVRLLRRTGLELASLVANLQVENMSGCCEDKVRGEENCHE